MIALTLCLSAMLAPASQNAQAYLDLFHAGHVALAAGDLPAAASALEAALEERPDAGTCAYALACVAARAGDSAAAVRRLEQAIALGWRDAAVARWDADLRGLEGLERVLASIDIATPHDSGATEPEAGEKKLELLFAPAMRPLAFSPDGRRLLTGQGEHVFLWDVRSGELVHAIRAARRRTMSAAFTPDSRRLVTAGLDGRVAVWDARTGEHREDLRGVDRGMPWMRITPDAAFVILQRDDSQVRRPLKELVTFSRRVMATSPDGTRQLTTRVGNAELVTLHDLEQNKEIGRISRPYAAFAHVGFSSDSQFAWLLDRQGRVIVLRTEDGEEVGLFGEDGNPRGACVHGERELLITWGSDGLRCWDLATGEPSPFGAELRDLNFVCVAADGRHVFAWGWRGQATLLSVETGEVVWRDESGPPRVDAAVFGDGGDVLAIKRVRSERLELLDTRSGERLETVGGKAVRVSRPRFLPDGRTVMITGSDRTLRMFDARDGLERRRIVVPSDRIVRREWTPDGRTLAVACADKKARLYDLGTGDLRAVLDAYPEKGSAYLEELAFDPAGERLLTFTRGTSPARVWSVAGGDLTLDADRNVTHAAWSPDGERIAVSNGVTLQLLDAATGAELGAPMAQATKIASLAYAPSGTNVVTGSEDETLSVWDVATSTRTHAVRHSGDFIFGLTVPFLRFNADGTRLVSTTSAFGTVQCWDTETWTSPWYVDYGGGNPSSLLAFFDASGERAYLSGMTPRNTRVVSMQDGKTLFDLADRGVYELRGSDDGAFAIGSEEYATVVFDAKTMKERYARTELEGGALLRTPHGWCAGPPAVVRASWVSVDGRIERLEALAHVLYDPKRVRAAAAGIELEAPPLPWR